MKNRTCTVKWEKPTIGAVILELASYFLTSKVSTFVKNVQNSNVYCYIWIQYKNALK